MTAFTETHFEIQAVQALETENEIKKANRKSKRGSR